MTRDRDIERVLDRFYAEGPSEMPDRVFLGVFDQIERVPQRRLALQMTRFATMNRNLRFALAAAIVVAVVGIGAFAMSKLPDAAAPPTPSPSIAVNPSATASSAQSVPTQLQGRWVGAPRLVPELPEPPYRNALVLSDAQLGFAFVGGANQKLLASIAALTAPDQLRLRGATTDAGCKPGDEGTYSFKLDASGTALTLTPISDACGPRAVALAGDWARVGCTDDQGWCLGDLASGSHQSNVFTPLVLPADWQYDYGRFSYTVPDGWANIEDFPTHYRLAKQGAPDSTAIFLWADVVPHSQDASCSRTAEPGVGRTASAITDWLTTLPGLVATTPTPVTVGGLSGFWLDLSVAADWTQTCPYSEGKPLVMTFVDSDVDSNPGPEGFDWNVLAGGYARYFLLDLGDGRTLLIEIGASDKASWDAFVADAMPVIETFVFRQ